MIDASREQVLSILDDIRDRVARGDTSWGYIQYQFPQEDGEGHDLSVVADYEVGELSGTTTMRTIGQTTSYAPEHGPMWGPKTDDGHPLTACQCGARPALNLHGTAWFAGHLKDHGAPDYIVSYWEFWADIVEATGAQLSRDQVARELADYRHLLTEIPKVYDELSGGRISKPNTAAHHVIEAADARAQATHIDLVLCDLLPQLVHGTDRQTVVDYVEDLEPGAYDEHLKAQERVSRLRAANAGAH
jgi:hypothetical protein